MAKITRNFLFIGFLLLGLVPTILCIVFPPTYGLVEQESNNGLNVTLNNWYKTREHPTIEMPKKIVASLQRNKLKSDQLFDSHFITTLQSKNKALNIKLKQENKLTANGSLYNMQGQHLQTTIFSNSNFNISLNNIGSNYYYLIINVEGNTYSKKIKITK